LLSFCVPTFSPERRRSLLRRLYDEALDGLPGLGLPEDAVRQAQAGSASRHATAEALLQRYTPLSGAAGFACGLPGYLSMPVTIPANLAGVAAL
jgi:hypothetical protein